MNIHFIGICGITMGSLAIAFKKAGHIVSGSDKGFYPPMSNMLKDANIQIDLGYKIEHLKDRQLDFVVVGNAISLDNEEYKYAEEQKFVIYSYPEVIQKYIVRDTSIVVTGTYGKTTITAMLVKIFKDQNIPISYMIGGQVKDFPSVEINDNAKVSIIEGDEYPASKWKPISKFFYYNPTHLIVTSTIWDHKDVFKTLEEYESNFIELKSQISDDRNIITKEKFDLNEFKLDLKVLGSYNIENAIFALNMCKLFLNIDITKAIESLNTFKGVSRRLEKRFENENLVVIDDFAHNPTKLMASISSVKEMYKNWKLIVVYEPNLGNRTKSSLESYKGAFKSIDKLYIPRWRVSKLKEDSELASENDLANVAKESGIDTEVVLDDTILVEKLKESKEKTVILFAGSEPFRGMIETLIKTL